MSARSAATLALTTALLAWAVPASADDEDFAPGPVAVPPAPEPPTPAPAPAPDLIAGGLGFARDLPRAWSASRDAPAFGVMMAPRGVRTAATEVSVLTLNLGPVRVRPGFYGLIELEGETTESAVRLWPSQEIHFWRASYAVPFVFTFDRWARAACASCTFEASAQFRHESEHYTGDNGGRAARDYADRPIYGDAVGLDVAAARRFGSLFVLGRAGTDLFLPGRSSYAWGAMGDLHARWVAHPVIQPFVSGFAQIRHGTTTDVADYPDAYLMRALAGVAFESSIGDVMLFGSGDVGHRTGLAAYTREATMGFGVRLALGVVPRAE